MWFSTIQQGFKPISISSGKELALRFRSSDRSRKKTPLPIFARFPCRLGLVALVGLMVSTTVFAQANGSKPVEQINYAKDVINYANAYHVCSSTYITNTTYLEECQSNLSALTSWVNAWESELLAGTLTVAYDTEVEDYLYDYEVALKTVLYNAGYAPPNRTPPPPPCKGCKPYEVTVGADGQIGVGLESDRPLAYQVAPDEIISPDDNAVVCTSCGVAAVTGYYVCLTTIEAPPVAAICGLGVAAGYIACAYNDCIAPKEPPKICPSP